MKKCAWIFVFLFMSSPCSAEFYKYRDETGAIRFTDDLSQVPEDQREKASGYTEVSTGPEDASAPGAETAETAEPDAPVQDEKKDAMQSLDAEAKRIDAMRAELEKEYNALVQEQERLNTEKVPPKNDYRVKQHSHALEELKAKRAQYDQKRQKYEAELKAYNEKVKSFNQ